MQSIIFLVIIILCLLSAENRKSKLNRQFVWMLATNIGVLTCDALTWLLETDTGPLAGIIVRIANAGVYSLGYIIVAQFTGYVATYLSGRTAVSRLLPRLMNGLCTVAVALVVVSQFNGMYYRFDANNTYIRGDWYWLSQAWAIASLLINMGYVLHYHRSLNRREIFAFMSYAILPVIAMAIQIAVYGLTLLYIATTLSMIIIYVNIQMEQAERLRRQEQELTDSRIAIMLSQIQPHFLYNALVAIKHLCDIDQQQAKEAIVDFSDYLRINLDSLTLKRPVHFEKELEHVKTYIALEKRRFGDRLAVRYDIQAASFLIPSLTLQPLVENAVRYGITKREAGGTITIATRDAGDAWQITITDDGLGFTPGAPRLDGRSHIGIDNVRHRLDTLSQGTLCIHSAPGEGTCATITIPKEGAAP